MDACGVCDGAGDQCATECSLTIATPSRRRELLAFTDAPNSLKIPFSTALGYAPEDCDMTIQVMEADPTQTDVRSAISAAVLPLSNRKLESTFPRSFMQVNLLLPAPASTTDSQGGASSPEDVTIRLLQAQTTMDGFPAIGELTVKKTSLCGDGLCSPGVTASAFHIPTAGCTEGCIQLYWKLQVNQKWQVCRTQMTRAWKIAPSPLALAHLQAVNRWETQSYNVAEKGFAILGPYHVPATMAMLVTHVAGVTAIPIALCWAFVKSSSVQP